MGCGNTSKAHIPSSVATSKVPSDSAPNTSETRSQPEVFKPVINERFIDPLVMMRQYAIGEVIGTGAFAQVKKVRHKVTEEFRALKIVHKSGLQEQQVGQNQLLQELKILQTLNHPSILHLYEWFEDKMRYYLVTELCDGGELFSLISSQTRLTEADVASIMYQVLSAVAYSHTKHVIHRDLKPENIFLLGEPGELRVKVADFGSSAVLDKNRRLSGVFGSGYYIAPEVIKGEYDEKCDIWSCGIILYILLTGVPPYAGRNEQEILMNVEKGRMNLRKMEGLSSDAIQLILMMLKVNPAERVAADSAFAHPWIQRFRERTLVPPKTLTSALTNLKTFSCNCKLKDAILTFIANQIISQAEEKALAQVFFELDQNGDGHISRPELLRKYGEVLGVVEAENEVTGIMHRVDVDGSGYIDYKEFLKASMERKKHTSKEGLDAAFRMFDRDGDGRISAEELRWVLSGGLVQDKAWQDLLTEVDANRDGEIDLREFMALVQSSL